MVLAWQFFIKRRHTMASKAHILMTPCHFQGIENDCQRSITYKNDQKCTHQAFGEFCRDFEIQKQLDIKQPRFVTGDKVRIGYPTKETHHDDQTDLSLDQYPTTSDIIQYFGFQFREYSD
jgi:hypothetical protein